MKYHERHTVTEYLIEETYISRVTGKERTRDTGMRCPKCSARNPIPGHGDVFHCRCGLEYQRYGNTLEM